MTELEQKQYIASQVSRAKEFMTTLILGELGCRLFKQIYRGDMYTLKTAEDVRRFKDMYDFGTEAVLVFEDLSLMTPEVQAALLKFIEEPKRPLIVLCSKDNISGAMMSRFMHYVKLEDKVKCKNMSVAEFVDLKMSAEGKKRQEQFNQDNPPTYDPDELLILRNLPQACLELCPEYWYWKTYAQLNAPHIHNPDKYIRLMFS